MPNNFPDKINSLLERYPDIKITKTEQKLNELDFAEEKRKRNQYPIEGGAIGIVLTQDGSIVLTKRTAPHRGWSLPGGRVEQGEEFYDAFMREVREECGIDIEIETLMIVEDKQFISPSNETLSIWLAVFVARSVSKNYPHQTDEALAEKLIVQTFKLNHLPEDMILKDKEKVLSYIGSVI
jgi:ADP-ribose pyrophosphatase YjhB (NUDIX family)